MLKRTTGRYLLTLLVVTGMAGTVKDTSLTSQERKALITDLKESRSELMHSVKNLSDTQLDFKPNAQSWSIRDCIHYIATSEKEMWAKLDAVMKEPVTPERFSAMRMADEDVTAMVGYPVYKRGQPTTPNWKTTTAAISSFKEGRTDHIKYAKSTTEDLRNHSVEVPFGSIDAYQYMLYMAAHCQHYTQQINDIKSYPGFPNQ
jgi:hypothetical protein